MARHTSGPLHASAFLTYLIVGGFNLADLYAITLQATDILVVRKRYLELLKLHSLLAVYGVLWYKEEYIVLIVL